MVVTAMEKIKAFVKKETVLSISWVLALASMALVPPDSGYVGYVDFHTLGLLFSLMVIMAGLQGLGLFRHLGESLLTRTATTRQLEATLVFLPFFSSMIVTNDVALITFVPFALEVLGLVGLNKRVIPVVVMQTIAANLGSMTTPIGNPQNLYLYSRYQLSLGDFFSAMLPLTAASALLLALFLLLTPSQALATPDIPHAYYHPGKRMRMYLILLLISMAAVAKVLPVWALTTLVLLAVLASDHKVLDHVDYSLLLTFVGFFLFVGNLGRLPLFRDFVQAVLQGSEVVCSVLASQVISNVPAALLLSGFTGDGRALLIGTNLGGLGTLIASMASLISYKYVARAFLGDKGRYLLRFTAANLVFLAALLALYCVIF